jgi:choline dehydrogenase-like flavoprotein
MVNFFACPSHDIPEGSLTANDPTMVVTESTEGFHASRRHEAAPPGWHPLHGRGPGRAVDSRQWIRGISGLRVIDASVIPTATTGNTDAPTILIREKGAAMRREDAAG